MASREIDAVDVPEPTWEIAHLFPAQGHWTEEEYLALNTNYLVEFSDGVVEVLPMPTHIHQRIAAVLYDALSLFVKTFQLGLVMFAPLRIQVRPGKYRQPDIVFMLEEHYERCGDEYWSYADLVMEIVSPDDPRRDLETKRIEYAKAGIPEYWIIDPRQRRILVLRLEGDQYAVHGDFGEGHHATSALLTEFTISVDEVFRAIGSVPAKPRK
jgi:Uma2 family endonuclease